MESLTQDNFVQNVAPTIRAVKNPRTRDLLRGLLTRHADANIKTTFANMMESVSLDDLPAIDKILRRGNLFKHLSIKEEFPIVNPPFFDIGDLMISPRNSLWPQYIAMRANENSADVVSALSAVAWINQSIFMTDDMEILASIQLLHDNFGHSLSLARKLAFILGYMEKDTESWRTASRMFASYGVNARNYGMMAVADSIGVEFSYLDVKNGFQNFSDYKSGSSASRRLAYLSFKPITFSHSDALDGIAASYSFSLLDAIIYVLCHRELEVIGKTTFDQAIEEAWSALQIDKGGFELFFGNESYFGDLHAFRAAPAFLEHSVFRNFRAATQDLYDSANARSDKIMAENKFERSFYKSVGNIRDLLPAQPKAFDPLPDDFDRLTSGSLARSCGLSLAASRNPDFSSISREEMASLMGQTTDIDRLLSTSTLRNGAKSAKDPFVALILQTLLRAHSPATKDNFAFKQYFQNHITNEYDGDVIQFLDITYDLEAAIVGYLVIILDETMLSQMPFIVKTAEDVYETRARILEWFSVKTGDVAARDRAKELRIDRKIAAVREQINETRLNIDSVRFRQWIDSSKLAEFSGLIRQEAFVVPPDLDISNKKGLAELKLIAHRDANARAAVAVMDCYREFCINSDFGVASYLGRRIRHGTLRGTLLDGLPDITTYDVSSATKAHYERWLQTFRKSIDGILAKLHFVGKGLGSKGVISAEIDSKEKLDVLFVCLRLLHEKSQADHGAATIPLHIEQYCWYIFEIELKDVQAAVHECRNEFGVFKIKNGTNEPDAIGFEKAVNIALATRFNTVAAWFKKPPNISPVAQLGDIVEVTLRETRAEFPLFNPEPQLSGTDIVLSGAVYYHVYDALSVIVRNAGKHGAHPGRLSLEAAIEQRDQGTSLQVRVKSQTSPRDSADAAVERMKEAGLIGAENADIIEGLSGMRKLEKMKSEKTLASLRLLSGERADEVTVECCFPLTGLLQ